MKKHPVPIPAWRTARPDEEVTPDTPVADLMFGDLGRLKSFSGSRNYPLPDGLNLQNYGSVVVWCDHFGVLISPARLGFDETGA